LEVFGASLLDEKYLHFVEELPNLTNPRSIAIPPLTSTNISRTVLNTEAETFTTRLILQEESQKKFLADGGEVTLSQFSPSTMSIVSGPIQHTFEFPFPVEKGSERVRIARKSGWIEIIPKLSRPPTSDSTTPRFPIDRTQNGISLWNMPYINFNQLAQIDYSNSIETNKWVQAHLFSMLSINERHVRDSGKSNFMAEFKETLVYIMTSMITAGSNGIIFGLEGNQKNGAEMLLFPTGLYLDGTSNSIVAEAYIMPLTYDDIPFIKRVMPHHPEVARILGNDQDLKFWKFLLPVLVERCRNWEHTGSCEYSAGIPVSLETGTSPICSCGKGKVSEDFKKIGKWKDFIPYVTRIAVTPVFAVPYLEPSRIVDAVQLAGNDTGRVQESDGSSVCKMCGKSGGKRCGKCGNVVYCSRACQRSDWKEHKKICEQSSS
jgi:MYND finger